MKSLASTAAAVLLGACASSSHAPAMRDDPQALAALQAEPRIMSGDTTWVTRGAGYELVTRTRRDMVAAQPRVSNEFRAFRQIFPSDTAGLLVTVRPAPEPGKGFVAAPLVPTTTTSPIVDYVLFDANAERNREARGVEPGPGMGGEGGSIIRALLASHAGAVTGVKASWRQLSGDVDDPRVPAWAVDAIASLASDATRPPPYEALSAHVSNLIPLSMLFAMRRPSFSSAALSGGTPPASGDEGRGGRQRGGGGGGGRGGGRGGMGGGRGESSRSGAQGAPALQGSALFDAEAGAAGHFLSVRYGNQVVQSMIDGQIAGKTPEALIPALGLGAPDHLENEWHGWLAAKADQEHH